MIIVVVHFEYKCIIVCFVAPPPQLVRQSRGTYEMDRGEFSMKKILK